MDTLEISPDPAREMDLLDYIERDPDVTQAGLAERLGIAVGTVNWHLKRLVAKGYVKVRRLERRKLKYLITPEGIALRARLTVDFIEQSMFLYRHTRQRVSELLLEVKRLGYTQVWLDTGNSEDAGATDLLDVCRLTCLEQGITLAPQNPEVPALALRGLKVTLRLPGAEPEPGG